jgi:hypothetical protein
MNKKNTRIITIGSLIILTGLLVSYSLFWWVMAGRIRVSVEDFQQQIEKEGYEVTSGTLDISGFPGPHRLSQEIAIKGNGVNFKIPSLNTSGFFLPGAEVLVSLPAGVEIIEPADPYGLWSIKSAAVSFIVPDRVPAEFTAPDLRAWQEEGNELEFTGFDVKHKVSSIKGNGTIALDQQLQPEIQAKVMIEGHIEYLQEMIDAGLVEQRQGTLIAALLAAASKVDEDTGKLWLETGFSLKNRNLYVGPAKVASLPAIEWPYPARDRHNQPDRPQ